MKHPLTDAQRAQVRAEYSRRYHLLLAHLDEDMRELEAQIGTMSIAEYNKRKTVIEELRTTLHELWERGK